MAQITGRRIGPRFLLMYPPMAFWPDDSAKPDGSLGLLYIAGALRSRGYDVELLDAVVGPPEAPLEDTFYRVEQLPDGRARIGMTQEAILAAVRDFDVVGLTNLYTAQAPPAAETVTAIKAAYPDKLVIVGGTNARHMANWFLQAGADLVFLSEAECGIVAVGAQLRRGSRDFSAVPGVAFLRDGTMRCTSSTSVIHDLDELPFPAWDLAPLDRYWDIARPKGGGIQGSDRIRYGSLMTSRGCPFKCTFCHISKEDVGSFTGNLRELRVKSIPRVMEEFDVLQSLDVEYVFIEDDSLLAKKKRALQIIRGVIGKGLKLKDLNGINIVHMCRPQSGRLVADQELFEVMAHAGFKEISLPFESASQRIIDKYATGKINLDKTDTVSIIKTAQRNGITVGGNYIIGWPDETLDEMKATIMLAKRHMDAGMYRANLQLATPYPGSQLFDMAVAGGHLDADFDPARMNWLHPTMRNTTVQPEVLDFMNEVLWKLLNPPARIASVRSMAPASASGAAPGAP